MADTNSAHLHMSTRYQGKVTIVTGGSQGIGEGCVRVFVQNGANVVICDKNEEKGTQLEAALNETYPSQAYFIRCDVTVEDDIKNAVEATVQKFGRIDCLINNAGTHPPYKSIDETTSTEFLELFKLNTLSTFLMSKYALPHLRKTQGNIINISSISAVIGQVGAVPYCASKGAIAAMSRALAVDESQHGVRVNAISPGNTWTPLWESGAKELGDPETILQQGKDVQLLGRLGTMEECGKLAFYLASDATFMTGVDLLNSGGAELNYGKKNRTGNSKSNPFYTE